MRRFILLASLLSVIFLIALGMGAYVIVRRGPLQSWQRLFPLQDYLEQQFLRFQPDDKARVDWNFELTERRLDDLVDAAGSEYEIVALQAFDQAFLELFNAIAALPETQRELFQAQLLSLINRLEPLLGTFQKAASENPQALVTLQARLAKLRLLLSGRQANPEELEWMEELQAVSTASPPGEIPRQPVPVEPHVVPFPAGSLAGEHAFFPLLGAHYELQCSDCHVDGIYAGRPNTCQACHVTDVPALHFPGDCEDCHNPLGWTIINFEHELIGAIDCSLCHQVDKPANHYNGQCSACHTTQYWLPASFDHAGFTDCQGCHESNRPVGHYSGQCSQCHNTSDWAQASFNHAGFTDCQGCHESNRPVGHYSGQCSQCHNTSDWAQASFDHAGFTDCQGCHESDRPGGHYSGQCSQCHNTSDWAQASFDHAGFTDCQGCHESDRPVDHYPDQCSQCHNTDNWGDVNFNHSGFTDCIGCHIQDRPTEHSSEQCSVCHNTNNWDDADDDD